MPDPDELAAAVAAIELFLAQARDPHPEPVVPSTGWRDSAKLAAQRLRPGHFRRGAAWNNIERLRAGTTGGFYGVVGL